ncbi:MAG: DJ-1/PfpI family protein [Defluviitaleaceae bacterium]|nr:DJ-1/PfpI family protein [Defluviitaleaceae bacterium]
MYVGDMGEAYIFLPEGFEEIEAVTVIDVLRRGRVCLASCSLTDNKTVCGSRGTIVVADCTFKEFKKLYDLYDVEAKHFEPDKPLLIMPGGHGVENYHWCIGFENLILRQNIDSGYIAAICAAPTVLDDWGILSEKNVTCYPTLTLKSTTISKNSVEVDGNIITAQGPASSMEFALKILETLKGTKIRDNVAKQLLF